MFKFRKYSGRYKKTNRGTIVTANLRVTQKQFLDFKRLNKLVEQKRKRLERKGLTLFGKQIQSLHFFKSQNEFNKQVKKLKKFANITYEKNLKEKYFQNYKKKIIEVFDDEHAKEIVNKMNKIGIERFSQLTANDEIDNISFLYTKNDAKMSNYEQNQLIDEFNRILGKIDNE